MLNAGTLKSYVSGLEHLTKHQGIEFRVGRKSSTKADVDIAGDQLLQEEIFGPTTIVIEVEDHAQRPRRAACQKASLIADEEDLGVFADVVPVLEEKAGRF